MKLPKFAFAPLLALAVLLLGLAGPVGADAAPAQSPDVELKTTVDQIRGMIKQHYPEYKADQTKFYQAVNDVVVPRFDVDGISKLVLGANYRSATTDQRTRFASAFRDMLVHTYANAMLDNYNSVNVTWMTPRISTDGGDATVNTTLTRDNGQSFAIGFRVHVVNGDWKIVDISVENISLVLNFRTQLNSEIKRTSLDDVIARMQNGQFKASGNSQQQGG